MSMWARCGGLDALGGTNGSKESRFSFPVAGYLVFQRLWSTEPTLLPVLTLLTNYKSCSGERAALCPEDQ